MLVTALHEEIGVRVLNVKRLVVIVSKRCRRCAVAPSVHPINRFLLPYLPPPLSLFLLPLSSLLSPSPPSPPIVLFNSNSSSCLPAVSVASDRKIATREAEAHWYSLHTKESPRARCPVVVQLHEQTFTFYTSWIRWPQLISLVARVLINTVHENR